ncbi:MAG: GTP-binding protein [bacterium]
MRRLVIMGAGGRDFHNFNLVHRDDPEVEVVAFTATQIPGIADRTYPPSLAGPRYPDGIPIRPEEELTALISREAIDEVVFAYSDVSYEHVMHRSAAVLAAGADFTLMGPRSTMIESPRPVVGVCAVRTGSGKSQTSLAVGRALLDAGLRVGLIRHPMPYHDLEAIRVQRFEAIADIDASKPTIEEREEYERPVEAGMLVYAGVDYAEIAALAAEDVDAIIWDGGNNDLPFLRPDLLIVVVDPLRPEDQLRYHPGEANLRMADVVLVNKADSASPEQIERELADVAAVNPDAEVLKAESPVTLEQGPSLEGRAVLVVEDGPSITHGGLAFGAGTVAAREAGATLVDPRPNAVGSIRETLDRWDHIGPALPAMGYSETQLGELEETINATDCDLVVTGTPINLGRIISSRHPIRHASYEFRQVEGRPLEEILAPIAARA